MAWFRYKAAAPSGEVMEGRIEAADEDAMVRQLHRQGWVPIRTEPVAAESTRAHPRRPWRRLRVTSRDLEEFTRELATLLHAGFSPDRALKVQLETAEREPMRRLLGELHAAVRRGASLSAAMASQDGYKSFGRLYVNLVRAGEAAGALEVSLRGLADFMERSRELRESVVSALIYPAILVCVACLSIGLILAVVVPRFTRMFADAGQVLPWQTRVVVAAAHYTATYWWVVLLVAGAAWWALRRKLRQPAFRSAWDARLVRLPLAGRLIVAMETSRFSRTLGTLVGNGVPLINALNIAGEAVGNRAVSEAVGRAAERVRQGGGLAAALQGEEVLPLRAARMIRVGEESGELDTLLNRAADMYERELRSALRRLIAVLEPALILGLGLVIGAIVMSIVTAILAVNGLGGI